jgi:MerR family copper efflux transcriptional regulator
MSNMTIGELAHKVGVNPQTIRFYERQRLLPEPRRRASGYRQYPPATIERVHFIRAAKGVGFTLEEVADLLALRVRRGASCAGVRKRAEAKLADIDAKLSQLQRMRMVLENMVVSCSGQSAIKDCAILEAIGRARRGDDCVGGPSSARRPSAAARAGRHRMDRGRRWRGDSDRDPRL